MKFLVTGLGSIGMRHAKNLLALGHEVWGKDTNYPDGLANSGVKPWHDSVPIDATIIASPTSWHAKHLASAIVMGWHCLVEKPIAEKYENGWGAVLALAKKENLVVTVGNNQRFRDCVQQAKSQLADIGKPLWASFTLSQRNTKYADHVISNWGAHELDLARYLLGPAKVVACVGTGMVTDILLVHANGCQTAVHLDYVGHPETREFLIVGNLGRVRCDLVAAGDNDASYIAEMKAFINRIRGGEDPIGATGEDGLEVLKLIVAAQEMAV